MLLFYPKDGRDLYTAYSNPVDESGYPHGGKRKIPLDKTVYSQ